MVTIAKGIEVLERDDQRVLINPINGEWIKLADYAYELALNPEGKPVRQLVAEESLHSGINPWNIESLFHYLEKYGFMAEISDVVTLARAYLNVTSRCNLTCPMCYFASNESPQHKELPLGDLCFTIDALAEVGLGNLVISGGEPLLLPNFPDILNYTSNKFPILTILTNGTLITTDTARQMSGAKAKVQVSVESANHRVHDSIRGPGSFGKAKDGIRMLLEAGVSDIEIVQTLTRGSIRDAKGVIELARTLGVDYHFSLFLPVGRGLCHMADMEIPTDELLRHFQRVCSESLKAGHETRCKTGYEASDSSSFMPPFELSVKQGCGAGSSIISIAPDGKAYPCPLMHTPDTVLGILPEESIWEIVRRGMRKIPDVTLLSTCSTCDVALFCGGGCRARAFAHTGDVALKDPYCDFYQRIYRAILWEWRDDRAFSDNMGAILCSIDEKV